MVVARAAAQRVAVIPVVVVDAAADAALPAVDFFTSGLISAINSEVFYYPNSHSQTSPSSGLAS